MIRSKSRRRRGVAAVEFAFVAPVMFIMILGLWEMGRMIQLQQTISNSAREGARLAAQSQTINSAGNPTQIMINSGTPNVKTAVVNYLKQAGLNVTDTDVTVAFAFVSGDTTKTEPYQGAKGQLFTITVTVPITSLRWTSLTLLGATQMSASVTWTCLVDDPFVIDPTIPTW